MDVRQAPQRYAALLCDRREKNRFGKAYQNNKGYLMKFLLTFPKEKKAEVEIALANKKRHFERGMNSSAMRPLNALLGRITGMPKGVPVQVFAFSYEVFDDHADLAYSGPTDFAMKPGWVIGHFTDLEGIPGVKVSVAPCQ
jgi:hypothetical protein